MFQTTEDSIDGDRGYGVGTWQFRAGFRCTNDGPNGPNFYSPVITIHVVPYAGTTPAPTPPDPAVPLRAVAIAASTQSRAAGRLDAALGRLNAHLTKDGAPAADVTAVRRRAAAAAKFLSKTMTARKALARKSALEHVRLRKADVPRALRKNPNVRPFVGKSLASLLTNKPFKTLRTVLRAQPVVH